MKNLPQDGPLGAVGKAWGTEGKPSGLRDEESQRERLVRAFSRGWVQEKAQCEPPTGRSRKGRNPCGKGRSWEINFRRLRGELGLEQAEEAKEFHSVAPRCCQPVPRGLQDTRYLVRCQTSLRKAAPGGQRACAPSKELASPRAIERPSLWLYFWGGKGGEVGQGGRQKPC